MEAKDLIKLGFEKSELTDKDIVDGSEYKVVDWRVKITDGLFIYTEIDQRRFEMEFNDKKDNHG